MKIPYNKKHEIKSRRDFEHNTYGKYPSNPQTLYEEKAPVGYINEINHQIDIELALKRLSHRQKVIAEAVLSGYKQQEIATQLKVNQATISREMHKIRQKLGDLFDL